MSAVNIEPIRWLGDRVRIIDQTRLPHEEVYLEIRGYRELCDAIVQLKIRGAPAIGVAGAYAIVLGSLEIKTRSRDKFRQQLDAISRDIATTRPTARNLFGSIERMQKVAAAADDIDAIKAALVAQAVAIHDEEKESTRRMSDFGATLIPDNATVLTHCNAGTLATTGYGTALGVIKRAFESGKKIRVFSTETRPLLQGARLTCWELGRAGIPFTLITDSMAGYFMSRKQIDCVIVGADHIAANGDTANKIGTYTYAVLAKENGIPFYVAAPTSTIDLSLASGDEIPIEQRRPEEVTSVLGMCISPPGCPAANPAFDITPHRYITAIITEKGVVRGNYGEGLRRTPE